LKVHFLPFNQENHYWGNLAAHLSRHGVDVTEGGLLKDYPTRGRGCGAQPDLLHLHWMPTFGRGAAGWRRLPSFLAHVARLRVGGHRFVWTAHNLYHGEAVWRTADRLATVLATPFFSRIIVHAPTAEKLVRREFCVFSKEKIAVVPHGNYVGSYPDDVNRTEARARMGIPADAFVFVFLGHIRPYKGVEQLIDAFEETSARDARLVIAGKPLDEATVPSLRTRVRSEGRVIFHDGFVPDERVQDYLRAADVMVVPYLQGLTSGAVVLGMSFGLPCIAADVGCVPDMLDAEGGFLYARGRADGLGRAMREAMEARGRLAEMGAYNRRKAEAWSWDSVAEQTAGVYREALR
jgi:glycosyltransferase involved in cell wall biosynthesis